MGRRVHELAKEFKISTAALKKHLSDLGVSVKSHMSIVDDGVVEKIRAKFNEQVAALKQIETDRKRFQAERERIKAKTKAVKQEAKTEKKEEYNNDIQQIIKESKTAKPKAKKTEDKKEQQQAPITKKQTAEKPTFNNAAEKHKADKDNKRTDSENKPERRSSRNYNQNRDRDYSSKPRRDRDSGGDNRQRQYNSDRNNSDRNNNRSNYRSNNSSDGSSRYNRNSQRPDNRNNQRSGYNNRNNQGQGYNNRNNQNQGYNNRNNQNQDFRNDRQKNTGFKPGGPKPQGKQFAAKPTTTIPVVAEDSREKRKFGKTKTDFTDKSKHIKAKQGALKSKKPKYKPTEVDEAAMVRNIKKTLAGTKKKKKYKKEEKKEQQPLTNSIVISEFTSVSELAKLMDIQPTEIITKLFMMGQVVTINQRLDKDTLEMICDEFEFDFSFQDEFGGEIIEEKISEFSDVEEEERPPVVTVMGHVDHGKTSILDRIKQSKIADGEAGGITQHIGAYQIKYNSKKITFLDTPGHEAFTAMRSRGANVTDIAIIVVAANDGVKPQTVEAIDHAKAAGVTIIVAINKVDLPEANIDRTISSLAEKGLYLEGYGGDISYAETSAKTGEGIDDLLELILLTSEMQELKAKKDIPAKGVVIESEKNQKMGVVATILLQEGSLTKGENIVCGATYGRVRKMVDDKGKNLKGLGPSDVAVLYGLNDVPKAGDILNAVESDKVARQISNERKTIRVERERFKQRANLNNIFQKIKEHQMDEVKLIIKADTDGSVEALADSFQKLSTDEVQVNIIHKSVGGIIEADIALAAASDAMIIGFHVRANNKAKKAAEDENVQIKIYSIIYDAIEDVKKALSGLLAPEEKEVNLGNAVVKQAFKIKKVGTIAGCAVEKGTITRNALLRIFRNNIMIHEGEISSLKHYANEVDEVKAGTECGIGIKDYNDIKEGDVFEAFKIIEVERQL